jgi:hypothetical protein
MAINRAELSNINEVMHFYENAEGENYKIYAKSTLKEDYIRYSFNGSKEDGIAQLGNDLTQINKQDNYMDYLLSVTGNVSRKGQKPDMVNITFQLNKPQYLGSVNNYQQNNLSRTEMLLEKLVEQNQMIVSRVSALEAEEDLEEEQPEEDGLAGILKNPEVQSMLIGAIGRFISGNAAAPAAIAGIPIEESHHFECIQIVESLMDKGVTIDHLRALDKMSTTKLKNLLLML